jgi:hypothetical protein
MDKSQVLALCFYSPTQYMIILLIHQNTKLNTLEMRQLKKSRNFALKKKGDFIPNRY